MAGGKGVSTWPEAARTWPQAAGLFWPIVVGPSWPKAVGPQAFLATGGAFRSSRQLVTSNGSKRNRGFSKKNSLRRMLVNLLVKNAYPTQFLSRSIIIISIIIMIIIAMLN